MKVIHGTHLMEVGDIMEELTVEELEKKLTRIKKENNKYKRVIDEALQFIYDINGVNSASYTKTGTDKYSIISVYINQ